MLQHECLAIEDERIQEPFNSLDVDDGSPRTTDFIRREPMPQANKEYNKQLEERRYDKRQEHL
jgi:hypothetical protein